MEIQMKKIVSLLLAAVLLSGVMLLFASCGTPEDAGAEINVYLGAEVFDFDPTDYYVSDNAEQVMSLMFEPLFRLDSDGDLEYGVAEDYEVDIVKRQIVITLRETYWSDEVRVKADDFIYAWREVLLDPNKPNPAAALLYDVENAVAIKTGFASYSDFGAVSSGSYEITITYREGADYEQLLANLASVATSPLRQDIVSTSPAYWTKDASTIVTNGPFRLEEYDRDTNAFSLTRNMGYHQPTSAENYTKQVTPASLVSFIAEDGELLLTYSDIEEKTVFFMGDATLEDRAANKDKATVTDDLSVYTYVFNTSKAPFDNADVRRALTLALNRAAMAEAVTFGKAATGFLPDPVAASIYTDGVSALIGTDYEADLVTAKSLISGAGLTSAEKKITLTVNNDEESLAIAELAKESWGELGFKVTVEKVDYIFNPIVDTTLQEEKIIYDSAIQAAVKDASYGEANFDVIAVDWQMYSTDAFVALCAFTSHMNGNGTNFKTGEFRKNISGWTDSEYDQYINASFYAKTEEERADALQNAERILLEDCPVAPVLFNRTFAFISDELSSIELDGLGNFNLTKTEQKNYQQYFNEE